MKTAFGNNMDVTCKTCGSELEIKSFKKYGVLLLISCLPMFPVLMFIAYGTIIPFLYVLFSIVTGCFLIFKKEKYFYFCKHCKRKITRSEIEQKG